jgi:nitroimidazol reductase NimA-like FMN-containing flavoprotein (pyridoxamine 5'-phosphate oxidase superfamily)
MRRQEKEVKEKAIIEEFLHDQEIGRLATSLNGKPYVIPINYVYTNGKIIFHSNIEGKKMETIALNPWVCFEVDSYEKREADKLCNYSYNYVSVVLNGYAKIIDDKEMKLAYFKRFVDKYAIGKGKLLNAEDLLNFNKLTLVEINIDSMTGKKSP